LQLLKGNSEMKKNLIAVLLVLSVATFGVFAETATNANVLTVGTIISSVNRMGIYGTGAPAPDVNTEAWQSNYTASYVTSSAATKVAVLHTRSNNRGGYTVEMTATPLISAQEGYADAYLGYTARALNGSDVVGTSTYAASAPLVEGSTVTIIASGVLTAITTNSRDISIEIPDFNTALEGTYTASIIFEYSAI
jgi:hypothetical protein